MKNMHGMAIPVSLVLVALLTPGAQAGAIVDGGTLLTQSYADEIANWLGSSNVTFTILFTKGAGDTADNFHAAVDGQGATITLLQETVQNQLIGGYDPVSWRSDNTWTLTPTDAERTAFVFNLTTSVILRQNLSSEGDSGMYQTKNDFGYGPLFGGGLGGYWDIGVAPNLTDGSSWNYAYGGTSGYNNVFGSNFHQNVYGAMEVFAVTGSSVPDPSSLTLVLGGGLLVVPAWRRRYRARFPGEAQFS